MNSDSAASCMTASQHPRAFFSFAATGFTQVTQQPAFPTLGIWLLGRRRGGSSPWRSEATASERR